MDDSTEAWRLVAIVANLVIVLNYAGLGLALSSRFDAPGPSWALRLFRWSGLAFFLGCSYSHAHMALHIYDGVLPVAYWATWHYLAHIVLQAAAGTASLILAASFVSIRIFDKRFTREMIDRMIGEATEKAAYLGRLRDVSDVAAEASRAREMADLILDAMQKDRRP